MYMRMYMHMRMCVYAHGWCIVCAEELSTSSVHARVHVCLYRREYDVLCAEELSTLTGRTSFEVAKVECVGYLQQATRCGGRE